MPGLRPTLFHNNHKWEGGHPLANLFQGTGALAIFISAVVCMLLLRSSRIRSTTIRLFLVWMAFSGFFQALPQVVMGAFVPGNDVGIAMDYFRMAAIPLIVAFRVPRELLEVLLPPVLATVVGLTAIYATAWRVKGVSTPVDQQPVSIACPLAAVVALLLIFQLVLRPGIAFY